MKWLLHVAEQLALTAVNAQASACCFDIAMRPRDYRRPLLPPLMQAQRFIPRRKQNAASVETIRDAPAFGNVAGLDDSSPSFRIWPRRPRGKRRGAVGIRSKYHACFAQSRQSIRSRRPSV